MKVHRSESTPAYEAGALRRLTCLLVSAIVLACAAIVSAETPAEAAGASQSRYVALHLSPLTSGPKSLHRYGIPFVEGDLPKPENGSIQIPVNLRARHIFLLGMSESANISCWADPRNHSVRFFIGDHLGQIQIDYADGSTQVFPLIMGESVWWGRSFYEYQEPFPADAHLRKVFAASLRLYPAAPVQDGKYVGVINPRPIPIRAITIRNSPSKQSSVVISGITVETTDKARAAGAGPLAPGTIPPEFRRFIETKSLHPAGVDEARDQKRLIDFERALYNNDRQFHGHVSVKVPAGYSGPRVDFQGNIYAGILTNVFYANVDDMLVKIDSDGMYHTSTRGATSWGGRGFGTFRPDVGIYYKTSWSRDMGRTLQVLSALGYEGPVSSAADYALRSARLWQQSPSLKLDGVQLPPHWGRVANRPDPRTAFENDGHGLIAMALYKLWLRLPNRDQWLRARWPDVKAAGDWIPWQFDHPAISLAANGVLHTTGESAGGNGYSVYADYSCMNALRALAKMADSIGESSSAALWRDRAARMQKAMAAQYIITDPKYGRVWTLKSAGWPNKSTVLGPLILGADYAGFAPTDGIQSWRPMDEAAYQRLLDTYTPFGFYGQAMGYGQGFVTQSALLLDRMHDATTMLNWAAKQIYNPRIGSYIVPEGVQIDPSGRFWYPAGDLGNGVQEAEIIKTLRIVIGIDDTEPARLQFFPRLPYGWKQMAVSKYPVEIDHSGARTRALVSYKLVRSGARMSLSLSASKPIGSVAVRLGPFANRPTPSDVRFNGSIPAGASIEHSGDSWWIKFSKPVGPPPAR